MRHGFCKLDDNDNIICVFNTGDPKVALTAPNIQHLKDKPLYELVAMLKAEERFACYTVHVIGEYHGFLHHDLDTARNQCVEFSERFGQDFAVTFLTVGNIVNTK